MVCTRVPLWLGLGLIVQTAQVQSFTSDNFGKRSVPRCSNDLIESTKHVAGIGFSSSTLPLNRGSRHNLLTTNARTRTRQAGLSPRPTTSLQLGLPAFSSMQAVLHNDPSFCLTGILLLSAFGISLERRTVIGKALSAPLATMALALIIANIGVMPFGSPIYSAINRYLVPLAVPMLLYDSDLRRVVRDTGSLLIAFAIGAVATVIGTLVAFPIIPLKSLGSNTGWRVACALAARHIGGAINFVAVAETLKIPASAVSAAIAADNVVVALYFGFLFGISEAGPGDASSLSSSAGDSIVPQVDMSVEGESVNLGTAVSTASGLAGESAVPQIDIGVEGEYDVSSLPMDADEKARTASENAISLPTLGIAISTASGLVTVGSMLTRALLPAGTSALPLTSILTVAGATVFPKFFTRIRASGTALGILCIQMFFAASGVSGSIALVLQQAPTLFAFSALQITVHFLVLMAVGKGIFRLPTRELCLASNANIGGPTTAAAMAQAKEWKQLVLPALLVGIVGYSTATLIALALGPVLLRLPILGQ